MRRSHTHGIRNAQSARANGSHNLARTMADDGDRSHAARTQAVCQSILNGKKCGMNDLRAVKRHSRAAPGQKIMC